MRFNKTKFLSIYIVVFLTFSSTTVLAATPTYTPNSIMVMQYDNACFKSSIQAGSNHTYVIFSDIYCSQNNSSITYYWTIKYNNTIVKTLPKLTALVSYNSFISAGMTNYNFPKKGKYILQLWSKRTNSTDSFKAVASRTITAY